MTVARRWISGSVANWARIGIGTAIQLASVPIFLSHWSPSQFGAWLVIASLTPVLTAIDMGHQNYLAYEFINAESDERLARLFSSSLLAGAIIGILGIGLTITLVLSGVLSLLLAKADAITVRQAELALIIQSITWLVTGSCGGLLGRAVIRYGHYPRTAWWGVAAAAVTGTVPLVCVILGGDLLAAALWLAAATLVINVPLLADLARVWLRDGVRGVSPDRRLALRNVFASLGITGRDMLVQVRQQGVRLVLAPLVGVAQMTVFSTTRTGANVALQGLSSIIGPLEPELLRFLRARDQERLDSALAVNWVIGVVLIAPGLMMVQLLMPFVFSVWTRGHIAFDPLLFALLSAAVAVYAYSQTATAIVRGNNLVGAQLAISAVTAIVTLVAIYLLVGPMGLSGAAAALLLAETVACIIYQTIAVRWMNEANLVWPHRLARQTGIATAATVVALLFAGCYPQWDVAIILVAFVLHGLQCILGYRALPELARARIAGPILRRAAVVRGRQT